MRVLAAARGRRGRRCSSSARARALALGVVARRCRGCAIGSTSVWPIVKRGFSDAYGFWNTTWMRRRIGSISRRDSSSRSRPSKQRPAAGRRRQRAAQQRQAERGLARARLADDAQRVALAQPEAHALHRLELARAEDAAAQPEALRRARRLDDHRRAGSLATAGVGARARRPCESSITIRRARRCVERRPAGEQRPRVGVLRAREDARRPAPARAPGPARITTTWSAISPTTPRSWLMNSTLIRCRSLQPGEQLEDLALHRHVERGRRLVGDQQLAARRPAPSRSSRAAAGRRTARADRRRAAAAARAGRPR